MVGEYNKLKLLEIRKLENYKRFFDLPFSLTVKTNIDLETLNITQ